MTRSRKSRLAFRPSLGDGTLEPRLVLSGAKSALIGSVSTRAVAPNNLTVRQLRTAVVQQLRIAALDAQQAVATQIGQLYANGRPTPQQKADFQAYVNGVLNATAFRASSAAALLPNGSTQLVPVVQQTLIGAQPNSLASRIQRAIQSERTTLNPRALGNALSQQTNIALNRIINGFDAYVRRNNLIRLSVDQTGQRIPLQQYIGNQVVNQLGNTLGSLSQSFPVVAGSTLFAGGATTATPQGQLAFANQVRPALSLAAFQLGNSLSVLPGGAASLAPQLQSAFFGTGAGSNSLLSALQALPDQSANFGSAASAAFGAGYQGLASSLSTAFGLPARQTYNLPSGTIPGVFLPQFGGFGNSFNTGFGSGFPGFGLPSSDFNPNFETGFNDLVTSLNTRFGFSLPPAPTGTGAGIGDS